jgi:DnaJ-like protein
MAFNRLAENRIREAIAEGKFDHLTGAGQPLDLEDYFSAPEDLRMAYSILKSARCAPVEVELLSEIARLKDALAQADGEAATRSLQQTLARRQTELAILLERKSRNTHGAT